MNDPQPRDEAHPAEQPTDSAAKVENAGEEASDLDLDLEVERIDTQGVLKEGFAGQEM